MRIRSRFAVAAAGLFTVATFAACAGGGSGQAPSPAPAAEPPATPEQHDAPPIISEMIEAHGGMQRWRTAPSVSFEDRWTTPGGEPGRASRVSVEQRTRRATIDFVGSDMRMSWDGQKAWSENWDAPYPPRFLALLNYYFLNLPWLTLDPGVRLSETGTTKLWDDPTEYVTVMMTFEPGVGDTPDDYYELYIDPQTKRLHGCKYVVTYSALLPEGVESTPPHILIYEKFTDVDGLTMPTRFTIYLEDHTPYAACEISDWSLHDAFDLARMDVPEGAVIDESSP